MTLIMTNLVTSHPPRDQNLGTTFEDDFPVRFNIPAVSFMSRKATNLESNLGSERCEESKRPDIYQQTVEPVPRSINRLGVGLKCPSDVEV